MTTKPDELDENGAQHYPETLRITVGGADEAIDAAIEQDGADDGVPDEAVQSFERVADIRTLLTDRRPRWWACPRLRFPTPQQRLESGRMEGRIQSGINLTTSSLAGKTHTEERYGTFHSPT